MDNGVSIGLAVLAIPLVLQVAHALLVLYRTTGRR
jgi:hypothetical protein